MINILKSRVTIVTILFAAFGGALSKLLPIDEMEGYYIPLTTLVAFFISLLISFLLKGSWNIKKRKILQIILVGGFICFIASSLYHTYLLINKTIPYRFPKGNVTYLVKGNRYTDTGNKYHNSLPYLSDAQILHDTLGGAEQKVALWEQKEIDSNTFALITSYVFLVIFFSASVFALLEILHTHYPKSQ